MLMIGAERTRIHRQRREMLMMSAERQAISLEKRDADDTGQLENRIHH